MITLDSRSTIARDAAARFATDLLMARCRTGAELALMPQGRWFASKTQGLHDWLHAGGFQADIELDTLETKPDTRLDTRLDTRPDTRPDTRSDTRTATNGRRSLAPVGGSEE